ncbi:ribonuclease HII [Brevundimonas naejangsanensis]|uniref:Ribonuclease HII n=1 Tax=Brevundimonas naejangsanensis TaxID=588932 RepID=A0A172Y9I6_9CAUL|nr:ribonuclease HII [Brevundimonas naejangsanensis]ANF55802.1 ribonuclease HII [Brevundimonas naejangsanensis]
MTSPKAPASKAPCKPDRAFPTLLLELEARSTWNGHICGIDEAGRGPWAGPVSAAAVILNPDDLPKGIDDSKALTEKRRAVLEIDIKTRALAWGVGFASVEEIDQLNILHATGLAMRRAVEALAHPPVHALVDGNYRFPLPCAVTPVVKGDTRSLSIAAASILAKTARDRLMIEMDATYPGYGFASHKGYNAPLHQKALQALGPCPEHRRSWAPIRALLEAA